MNEKLLALSSIHPRNLVGNKKVYKYNNARTYGEDKFGPYTICKNDFTKNLNYEKKLKFPIVIGYGTAIITSYVNSGIAFSAHEASGFFSGLALGSVFAIMAYLDYNINLPNFANAPIARTIIGTTLNTANYVVTFPARVVAKVVVNKTFDREQELNSTVEGKHVLEEQKRLRREIEIKKLHKQLEKHKGIRNSKYSRIMKNQSHKVRKLQEKMNKLELENNM